MKMMDEIKNEVEEVEEEDQFLVNINKDISLFIKDLDEFAESFNSSLEKAAKNILGE